MCTLGFGTPGPGVNIGLRSTDFFSSELDGGGVSFWNKTVEFGSVGYWFRY